MSKENGKAESQLIICRCEEITEGEILRAIKAGCRSVAEIKRFCRAGMGLCQGKICGPIIRDLIARETGITGEQIAPDTSRFPLFPVELKAFRE